jgi:hypothetical protein
MGQFLLALKRKSLTSARSGRPTAHAFWLSAVLFLVVRRSSPACVPCMLSCSGVKVPCPGVRGAEGQGKRKGAFARRRLKEAWNEGAGRGTRPGYEVWYSRDERARDRAVLHAHVDCALYIRRLCIDGMTAYHGRPLLCPGKWRATETG